MPISMPGDKIVILRSSAMKFAGTLLSVLFAAGAIAQQPVNVNPGSISYSEGLVYIDGMRLQANEGRVEKVAEGKSLQTGAGKAEVQLGMMGSLWMGDHGILRMEKASLENMQLRMERGSMFVEIIEGYEGQTIVVHSGEADIVLSQIGIYRIDCNLSQLRVYNGLAEVRLNNKKAVVNPGKLVDFSRKLKTSKFDAKQKDALNYWAGRRSYLLYGKIKEARKAAFMAQQLNDLHQQRQIEEAYRQNARQINQMQQYEEAQRISEQQMQQMKSEQEPPPVPGE